ncbi:MAG: LuxR C-terminal-related transcriptional regulator, partial [Cyanobacteria bacterium J06649_4]
KLFISEHTVRNHITSILSQLQLSDRTQVNLTDPKATPYKNFWRLWIWHS